MAHAVVLITSKIPVEFTCLMRVAREQNNDLDLAREVLGQRRVATELNADPEAYAVVVDLDQVGTEVLDHDPAVLVWKTIDAEIPTETAAPNNNWAPLAHPSQARGIHEWWTPQEHEGQTVTVSYAIVGDYAYSRSVDASDRTTTYMRRPVLAEDDARAVERTSLS